MPNDLPGDLWLDLGAPPTPIPEFRTWAAFERPGIAAPKPLYITEAGPGAFDAFLATEDNVLNLKNTKCSTVAADTYCRCLLSLALGRESVLFDWDDKSKQFTPALQNMKITGYIGDTLQGVLKQCLRCGNAYKRLQEFVHTTYSKNPTPCRVALASALHRILLSVQGVVAGQQQQPRSVLQLQAVVRRMSLIVLHCERVVSKIRRDHGDEDILTMVFVQAQAAEHGDAHLAKVMREVLQRVAKPWFDFLEEWIGTKPELGVPLRKDEAGSQKGFIKVEAQSYIDDHGDEVADLDFQLDRSRMPNFIPADIVQTIFETGRNLRFIRSEHSDHVLAYSDAIATPPSLSWMFDWESINHLEQKVLSYERTLVKAISTHDRSASQPRADATRTDTTGIYKLQMFGTDEAELQMRLQESMKTLSQPHVSIPEARGDPLEQVIQDCIAARGLESGEIALDFAPHWSLIPVLSLGSLVASQNRVVGRESLKLLYTAHGLKQHLALQREFHLCKSGMFCSRLSHALFDPDLESAERQAGIARQGGVMGLRLSGRDTWPPASSELRLALMGVLSESYDGPLRPNSTRRGDGQAGDLPGDLSFGVRDLSGEEIDKCMDPDGLEALDFLRLSYKTPPALTSVITPVILVQYDRVFKLLLRVLRMQYTVNQVFCDVTAKDGAAADPEDASIRFCFEARHFVFNLSAYFFDVGIDMSWKDLESRVAQIEELLFQSDDHSMVTLSPDRLREYHSRVLDRIMSALLLRKRQQPVMNLLEEIFRVILRFAKYSRLRAAGLDQESPNVNAAELYKKFRKGVEVFLTVCRAMMEKQGSKNQRQRDVLDELEGKSDGPEESPLTQLLLRLDMFGYYSRT